MPNYRTKRPRRFVCYFHFIGWANLALGLSLGLSLPDIQLHLPFGFIRIGFAEVWMPPPINWREATKHSYGHYIKYPEVTH